MFFKRLIPLILSATLLSGCTTMDPDIAKFGSDLIEGSIDYLIEDSKFDMLTKRAVIELCDFGWKSEGTEAVNHDTEAGTEFIGKSTVYKKDGKYMRIKVLDINKCRQIGYDPCPDVSECDYVIIIYDSVLLVNGVYAVPDTCTKYTYAVTKGEEFEIDKINYQSKSVTTE